MMTYKIVKLIGSGVLLGLASSAFAASSNVYSVVKGDSLYGISNRYNVPLSELISSNNLRGKSIQVGQTLKIPDGSDVSYKSSTGSSGFSDIHVVRRGESLSSIARKFNVDVDDLAAANRVSDSVIQVGQKLKVPHSDKVAVVQRPASPKSSQAKHVDVRKSVALAPVQLESNSAIVVDAETGQTLYSKNSSETKSIASITKLMTAMVALDAQPSMDEVLRIEEADVDHLKHTSSRMPVGTQLPRYEMLRLALMSSENRAASSLSRHYPGGQSAFVAAMNQKAQDLGMTHTHFSDPTGLTPMNVSTAEDLVKMVTAASHYDLIHQFTTTPGLEIALRPRSTPLQYKNSNRLVQKGEWDITVSKTGFINEAGRCLVMMASVANRPAVMVFLKSQGKLSPVADANRIKKWMEKGGGAPVNTNVASR